MPPIIETRALSVGHLPLVRWVMGELGIFEVIEELCTKHQLSRVSDAECVGAMVLKVLSGRTALYAMETWRAHTDTDLLIGEGCEPEAFNDERLAVALDHLDQAGSDRVMGALVERYLT